MKFTAFAAAIGAISLVAATASAGPLGPHGEDWTGVRSFTASGTFEEFSFGDFGSLNFNGQDFVGQNFLGVGNYRMTLTTEFSLNALAPFETFGFVYFEEAHYDFYDASGALIFGRAVPLQTREVDHTFQRGGFAQATFRIDAAGPLSCPCSTPVASVENFGRGTAGFVVLYTPEMVGSHWTFNVVKLPIPEPATWAALILGFATIGLALRRRRRLTLLAAG